MGIIGRRIALTGLVFGMSLVPEAALGQVPPDSIRPDSAAMDTLRIRPEGSDSLQVGPGEADTLSAEDTIFYNLPDVGSGLPAGWGQGVWHWDREALQVAAATTLGELLDEVPGVVPLLGGDYGTPEYVTAFAADVGRIRVFRDGFELLPMDGGVTNLTHIGLAGIEEVTLDRQPGGIVIHLSSLRHHDARPASEIEVGTGELDTNIFRGTFLDPSALGGSVAVALDRSDTRGDGSGESGSRTGTWLRYQRHWGDDFGVALDYRSLRSETAVSDFMSGASRSDWVVRVRKRVLSAVVGEVFRGNTTLDVKDEREAYLGVGGSRSQTGASLSASLDAGVWGRATYRRLGGDDLPSGRMDLEGGVTLPWLGGVAAEWHRGDWPTITTTNHRLRAWTRPVAGLSLFASRDEGWEGGRMGPAMLAEIPEVADTLTGEPDPPADPAAFFRMTHREATRAGGRFSWRGVDLSGAVLDLRAGEVFPLGIAADVAGEEITRVARTGWEVWGRVPVPVMPGLNLVGSLQQWDEEAVYLPRQIYRGAFQYHRTFLETGNFELWWTVGVRGRDPMLLPTTTEAIDSTTASTVVVHTRVPFHQSWYGRIQARIMTLRIFVAWENFTRRDALHDFPGRVQPRMRAVYGIRWSMWN